MPKSNGILQSNSGSVVDPMPFPKCDPVDLHTAAKRCGLVGAVAAAIVACTIGAACAFEQSSSQSGSGDQPSAIQGIQIAPQSSGRGTGMELTLPGSVGGFSSDGRNNGVGIPGLGNLPKFDFGLELLYGPAEQGSPNADQGDAVTNALTVHGAVKKSF